MNTAKTLFFCATLGMGLTACNVDPDATVSTVSEECSSLVNGKFIGQNGPEVCVTTPLSKSATSISGTIVGTTFAGPFMVTAVTSDGVILKQVSTLSNGDFTMSQLNLQNLPGKGISFSVFVNGISSPPTKLVVGQEPPSTCSRNDPNYPLCGTYPSAIFFPIKTSITTIFSVSPGEFYTGATLLPYLMGLYTTRWSEDRYISSFPNVPAPIKPGDEQTVYATIDNTESFAYPVKQTVLPVQQ
ncbi:hypothetical protein D3C76_760580 [compost metagenome]|jgi:hypothetical protein|uniref:Lipoprotein n=1 Tax=Pseudomonas fluorescens TaxID=294 RepID=A0A5E7UPI4_PSEFL|nr:MULTISPECIES: hypothetical protein [Pseudomonas]PBJ27994.1 hypothetical protein BSF44_02280 [Pseudomonas sp. ACN8]VVQ12086.1 hypothetical protein PS938_03754 [Pseudomonas fluorescens]